MQEQKQQKENNDKQNLKERARKVLSEKNIKMKKKKHFQILIYQAKEN